MGLENIPQVQANQAKVGQNHDARDFDQLPLDFPELGGYFTVSGTLTYFLLAFFCKRRPSGIT